MTRLSERQELHLAIVATADQRWRDAKRTVEADVRREVQERTAHLLEARNDAVLLAREERVPSTQIAYVGLHTRSTASAREAIADARERRRLREEAQPPRFRRGDAEDHVVVQLHGAELDLACRAVDWSTGDAIQAGVTVATFRVLFDHVDPVAIAVTEGLVGGRPHPVVSWGRLNRADIVRFAIENR